LHPSSHTCHTQSKSRNDAVSAQPFQTAPGSAFANHDVIVVGWVIAVPTTTVLGIQAAAGAVVILWGVRTNRRAS